MKPASFSDLQTRALQLAKRFPHRWDEKTHYIDLVEEVGELGNALLIKHGDKSSKRRRAQLHDSFADILFELIVFADTANIDLLKELDVMLTALEARLNNNDYEDENSV